MPEQTTHASGPERRESVSGDQPSLQHVAIASEGLIANSSVGKVTVLVVDDDQDFRRFCIDCLNRAGCGVIDAVDGHDALVKVEVYQPDVIIMDVRMPRMDGLQCTKALKANPATASIPIVMASSADSCGDSIKGLEAGADEYLVKSIKPKEFILRVMSMVRLRRAYNEVMRTTEVLGMQNRDLSILLDLSCDLGEQHSIDGILNRVVDAAIELTGCRLVAVVLPDKASGTLRVARCSHPDSDGVSGKELSPDAGIIGEAYRTRRCVVVQNESQIQQFRHASEASILNGWPVIAAPMCTSEQTVGVITAAGRLRSFAFSPKELAYLDLLTNLSASAIQDSFSREERDWAYEAIVIALAQLAEYRDDDTGQHLDRVTRFSLTLSHELRRCGEFADTIDDEFIQGLKLAVPLHDIGKVAIPDSILLKPGRLDPAEMETMRRHVDFGARTIRSIRRRSPGASFLQLAEDVCQCHHEWFDGNGYPRGLRGEQIPVSARIAAIADVYDALTTRRVYKPAMTHERAFQIITEASGTQFDPRVVQAFVRTQDEFVRLARELSDGDDVESQRPDPVPAAG